MYGVIVSESRPYSAVDQYQNGLPKDLDEYYRPVVNVSLWQENDRI